MEDKSATTEPLPEVKATSPRRTVTPYMRKDDLRIISKNNEKFITEFIKTGGNATEAAQRVHPKAKRTTAAQLGTDYLKKNKPLIRMLLEEKGLTYGKMIDLATAKLAEDKTPAFWDRLMKLAGYEDFLTKDKVKGPGVVNIIQTQKQLISEYVEGEVEEVNE